MRHIKEHLDKWQNMFINNNTTVLWRSLFFAHWLIALIQCLLLIKISKGRFFMCFYIFFVCFVGCHLIHIKCFVMTTSFWFQNISSLQSKTLYTVSSFSPLPHIHRPWQPPVSLMDLCPSSTSSIPPHPSHLTINRFSVLMSKFVLFVFFF